MGRRLILSKKTHKSVGVAFWLTFFFGPLGLIYTSFLAFLVVVAGFVFLLLLVAPTDVVGVTVTIMAWGVTWLVSVMAGIVTAQRHSAKVDSARELAAEARHQETLATLTQGRAVDDEIAAGACQPSSVDRP